MISICFECVYGEWGTERNGNHPFYSYNCLHSNHSKKDIDPGNEACEDFDVKEEYK